MGEGKAPVVVVGGGAAGMLAAGAAAAAGARVQLLEKNSRLGRKIAISGQSRCNLTNVAEVEDFVAAFGPKGRFLRGPFNRFFRDELLALLERFGVATQTERGGRVFPVSGRAEEVVTALQHYLAATGVEVHYETPVTGLQVSGGQVQGVMTRQGPRSAAAVIIATGGASFPRTGSTGDGYELAAAVGHTVVTLRPALVPLLVEEVSVARSMQGVSLRNVRLTAYRGRLDSLDLAAAPIADCGRGIAGKKPRPPVIESRQGEMMMTHFGLGGPVTLLMSLAVVDALAEGPVSVVIDLKPAVSTAQLRQRLQSEFEQHGRRSLRRLLGEVLPAKMIEPYLTLTALPGDLPGHQIRGPQRDALVASLKGLGFNVRGPLPLTTAIVTAGGVSLKEVDSRTMTSRLVTGLYLAGEVLDLDADTGGYNLQAAFTTGHLAGLSAAQWLGDGREQGDAAAQG